MNKDEGANNNGDHSPNSVDSSNYQQVPKNDSFVFLDSHNDSHTPRSRTIQDNRPPSNASGIHLHSDSEDNVIVNAQPVIAHAIEVAVVDENATIDDRITDASPLHVTHPTVTEQPGVTKGDYVSFDHGNSPKTATGAPSSGKRNVDIGGRSTIPAMKSTCSLCCCVMGLSEYSFEQTFGIQTGCHALCYEHSLAFIHPVEDKFYMMYGTSGLVKPNSECDCYTQCFPLHCFMGYPESDIGAIQNIKPGNSGDTRSVEPNNRVVPCGAVCCTVTSLYLQYPECLSTYTNLTACCFHAEFIGMRMTFLEDMRAFDDMCCVFFRGQVVVISPDVFLKGITQSWCFDNRVALPCTEEVPFMLFCLPFCSICVNMKPVVQCGNSVEQLVAAAKAQA